MRNLLVVLLTLLGCTKPNPNRCCTSEADCAAFGIPVGSTCGDGLLCRGHQCIAQPCDVVTDCDASAPYCAQGACAESCSADDQCPGLGNPMSMRHCVAGACAECREDVDCPTNAGTCDQGTCRPCLSHEECASGVCDSQGCVAPTDIAYVAIIGSATSDCSEAAPCSSIARALALSPERRFILISSGTYASATGITFVGTRTLIGRGATRPILQRTTSGPIVSFDGPVVDARLEYLTVRGASDAGILCSGIGNSRVDLHRVIVEENAFGVRGSRCSVTASLTTFRANTGSAVEVIDANGDFDRCTITENGNGMNLDSGVFSVTNSFIVRNQALGAASAFGISIYATTTGQRIEFNTIADNVSGMAYGGGMECNLAGANASFPNNIIVRNSPAQIVGTTCTFPGSLAQESIEGLNFKSPDAAPYDYHLTAGSIAIDQATISSMAYDFDGDARPQGAGRDIGADEFVP
jgi:hypothetical protein